MDKMQSSEEMSETFQASEGTLPYSSGSVKASIYLPSDISLANVYIVNLFERAHHNSVSGLNFRYMRSVQGVGCLKYVFDSLFLQHNRLKVGCLK